jgi:hypothetical protein
MKMHSKTKPCLDCGEPIPAEFSYDFLGKTKTLPALDTCDKCQSKRQAEWERLEKMKKLDAAWRQIAPPRYQQSDPTEFPIQLQDELANFDPTSDKGFGIRGPTARCKTRFGYELLKIAHFSGFKVSATNAVEIADLASSQWDTRPDLNGTSLVSSVTRTLGDKSRNKIAEYTRADWLLIDDIAKEKPTERFEITFYNLLEHRTSHCRPIIWTTNMPAAKFMARFSEDRSEPIIRRLVEFAKIILLE